MHAPCRLLAAMLLAAPLLPAVAADEERPFKLTLGRYDYGQLAGVDVNLRWRRNDTSAWLGYYRDRDFGSQWRAGWDTSIELAESVSLQPSVQVAERGFVGGSLNLQAGDPWFGLVGFGRTNLKPYFNLNFDPNDAVTLGVGRRFEGGGTVQAFVIADDRLGTGQRHAHLNLRWPIGRNRLTLDLLRKTGQGDDGPVQAWGGSVTWDWPRWSLRLARDPKQNFSAQDATRLSIATRF